jgi:hypothetical protein
MSESILKIIFQGESENLDKKLKEVGSKLDKFNKKASALGKQLTTRLSLPLAAAGGAAIKFASDFNESLNKVDVAFGSSQDSVKDFAKTALKQFGIAEGSALDMAALFGDMATSMGFAQDSAAGMSTELVGLAGDLASFKNIDIEQATTALAGVFTGETESLKRLGIVMTEVNLKQFAMDKGLNSNIKNMTQSQKVALRYQFIMEKTANAQGDFARTGGGAANQMRIFQEALKQLAANFGQILLPAFTKILLKVNAFIIRLSEMSPETKKFIAIIGGLGIVLPPIAAVLPSIAKGFALMGGALKLMTGPIGIVLAAVTALTIGLPKLDKALNVQTSTLTKIKNLFFSGGNMANYAARQMQDGTPIIDDNKESLDELTSSYDDFAKKIQEILNPIQSVNREVATSVNMLSQSGLAMTGTVEILSSTLTKAKTIYDLKLLEMKVAAEQFNEEFGFIVKDGLFNLATGIGEALGQAIATGQNAGQALAQVLLGSLGGIAIQLGQVAIGIGISLKKIKIALKSLSPGTAIAAGIALVALGSFFKAKSAQIGDSMGATKFAKGGIVSTPTLGLMGEYPGARSNPEVIAPLDKLQGMIANTGGSRVEVGGQFTLKGQDLIVALQRADRNRQRIK